MRAFDSALPPTSASGSLAYTDGWHGSLKLGFARRNGRTVIAHKEHHGPLLVQSPFYPDDGACHVYVLHPPGGVVAGDQLTIELSAAGASHVVVTTPAANKLYRSDGRLALLTQHLRVEPEAALEWLPQETIAFPDVRARTHTRVDLSTGARFIGWEHWCLGLPSRAERLGRGRLDQRISVYCDQQPLLIERQPLVGDSPVMEAAWGLAGNASGGTLLAYPSDQVPLDELREHCAAFGDGVAGATQVEELTVVRALSHRSASIGKLWRLLWSALRPAVIGAVATPPRIWAT